MGQMDSTRGAQPVRGEGAQAREGACASVTWGNVHKCDSDKV